MQRQSDGSFRFSPRDLIAYLEGDFAAWCERRHAEESGLIHEAQTGTRAVRTEKPSLIPDEQDAEADLVIRRGFEHEYAHLARLKEAVDGLIEIAEGASAHADTRVAMVNGAPVIYQGELQDRNWRGISDFLQKRPGASTLGDFHYEPWDTKLARSAKPYFLLQLSSYAEMLEVMQGKRPENLGFVLGDGSEKAFRTGDVWHYYSRLKRAFEGFHAAWSEDNRPDPALERNFGRWSDEAERYLRSVDDLSIVAGITRSQVVRLREAGITTVTELASCTDPALRSGRQVSTSTFTKLREQAAMQIATRAAGSIQWKLRPVDAERPRRGLALLPPASPNDVFFDIEGFPYAPGGLEYLLGIVTVDSGKPEFRDWWSHDDAQEKRAFEDFIDFVYARWKADPQLHVYHYASYEKTAICRLMGKYGTREFEVDELLRNDVLVDLYNVTLQGVVIGTESYSLKYIEPLYMSARTGSVKTAGSSVVEYQRWLDSNESPDPGQSPVLHGIREYNKVDCESTVGLRDWLLGLQQQAGVAWMPPEAPKVETTEQTEAEALAAELLSRAEGDGDSEAVRVATLVAHLLEFHRRDEKPFWWTFFDRLTASDEELRDDQDCLAGLVRTSTPIRAIKKSSGYEYRFDPGQDTRLEAGDDCALSGTDGKLKCVIERFVDKEAGLIELRVGPGKQLPDHVSLIPCKTHPTKPLRDAVLRFANRWKSEPRCEPALADLLGRRVPQLQVSGKRVALAEAGLPPVEAVRALDGSTLCIQGPPGTGKTTTATAMILALIADGKRVGVLANSHSVVLNLIARVAEQDAAVRVVKVTGDADHPLIASGRIAHIQSAEAAASVAAGPLLIGGTAWLFARADMEGALDYLFVEEAGQVSLANVVACGSAARNLVLLGDQMQLAQPTQGSHPGDSGSSALVYLLGDHATVPPELGIFLGVSHRMHPEVCRFISDAYYEGRLTSSAATAANCVTARQAGFSLLAQDDSGRGAGPSLRSGRQQGVRFVPVEHDGNTTDSEEECEAVERLVAELLKCDVTVKDEQKRRMTLADILIVAPFNMQVRALKRRLPNARIGSVDKFQGQEAPVVIVTMCASTLEDAPRGAGFLLSKNRLNVAISRAQALAIVVGSPKIGNVRVRSIEEMFLVSGWCRIEECG